MSGTVAYLGGPVFDGDRLLQGQAAVWKDGLYAGCVPEDAVPSAAAVHDLRGDILSPGYVDLQVNGGDGLLLNDDPSVATLRRMAEAHRSLGATRILPTLITDTPEVTQATIRAAQDAVASGTPGIAGLHLEGPHLSVARKGAHDGALIRPMRDADLRALLAAKANLPVLKVTVAPESVSPAQVAALAEAGVIVALGHSDATFDTCMGYAEAGARCVTHLFNAMSQLGNRQPGLVGAALANGALSAGLIADGLHVHPAVMRAAWQAKTGPGRIYLVSDAMAVAGTDETVFALGGRKIVRQDGRLTLEDGTLAGADLDLTRAIKVMVSDVGIDLVDAVRAATTVPADVVGLRSGLVTGETPLTEMIRIAPDLSGATPLVDETPLGGVCS